MEMTFFRLLCAFFFVMIVSSQNVRQRMSLSESCLEMLNAGVDSGEKGDFELAARYFHQATQQCPNAFEPWANLGLSYAMTQQYERSRVSLERAASLNPKMSAAFVNMGNVLKHINDSDITYIRSYQTALRLQPRDVNTLSNLAGLANRQRKYETTVRLAERSIREAAPMFIPEAQLALEIAIKHTCDWYHPLSRDNAILEIALDSLQNLHDEERRQVFYGGMSALYMDLPPQMNLAAARVFAENTVNKRKSPTGIVHVPYQLELLSGMRLRLAYVGQDFTEHPMMQMMQGMFREHDRAATVVLCFATNKEDGNEFRQLAKRTCDEFEDISDLNDEEAAAKINAARPHIMINLFGMLDRERNGIAAYNPAPVQINHRWCSTTGANYTHWHVTDRVATPPDFRSFYAEALALLPHSYLPNDHAASYPLSSTETADDDNVSEEQEIVVASFNNVYKLERTQFESWCRTLAKFPAISFWLLTDFIKGTRGGPRFLANAMQRGVERKQIVILPFVSKDKHIQRSRNVDILLDTWAVNSHSTAVDVLWAGGAFLSAPREKMAARVGASLLKAIGCEKELLVRNAADYEELLEVLIQRPQALTAVKRCVRRGKDSALFDLRQYMRHVERLHRMQWDLHQILIQQQQERGGFVALSPLDIVKTHPRRFHIVVAA